MRPMNWNMDIKDLTKRQIFWLVMGIAAFGGVMVAIAVYGHWVFVLIASVIVYFGARWHLTGKDIKHMNAEETDRQR
jgi:hypothetical protein